MKICLFSLLMSFLQSSIYILVILAFKRKAYFINSMGVFNILVVLSLCILRMLLRVEFFFRRIIKIPYLHWLFYHFPSETTVANSTCFGFDILQLCVFVWMSVGLVLFIKKLFILKKILSLLQIPENQTDSITLCLNKISTKLKKKRCKIVLHEEVLSPMAVGVFNPVVLIPLRYQKSSSLLCSVIEHELTHVYLGDNLIKVCLQLFICIFWWNPLAHILVKEFEDILEIRCDLTVTQDMPKEEVHEYVSNLLEVSIGCTSKITRKPFCCHVSSKSSKQLANCKHRIGFIVSHFQKKPHKTGMKIFVFLVSVFIFLSSYFIILQPYSSNDSNFAYNLMTSTEIIA